MKLLSADWSQAQIYIGGQSDDQGHEEAQDVTVDAGTDDNDTPLRHMAPSRLN